MNTVTSLRTGDSYGPTKGSEEEERESDRSFSD